MNSDSSASYGIDTAEYRLSSVLTPATVAAATTVHPPSCSAGHPTAETETGTAAAVVSTALSTVQSDKSESGVRSTQQPIPATTIADSKPLSGNSCQSTPPAGCSCCMACKSSARSGSGTFVVQAGLPCWAAAFESAAFSTGSGAV